MQQNVQSIILLIMTEIRQKQLLETDLYAYRYNSECYCIVQLQKLFVVNPVVLYMIQKLPHYLLPQARNQAFTAKRDYVRMMKNIQCFYDTNCTLTYLHPDACHKHVGQICIIIYISLLPPFVDSYASSVCFYCTVLGRQAQVLCLLGLIYNWQL